jgi:dTDP-4-amino-4,6-dideoxygalactose transaminase
VTAAFLPLTRPSLSVEEEQEVLDTLRSGWLSTGPKTQRFERDLRAVTGAAHALALNSCTAALHLALSALGVGPGDEVIVPTITFPATINVVLHRGARPVLADVDPRTLNIDPVSVQELVGPRTQVVIPVHVAGQPADMEALWSLAAAHDLAVVEDAAQALGAELGGRAVGSLVGTTATCFSFHPSKSMTTAEGGALLTDQPGIDHTARVLSNHGLDLDSWSRRDTARPWAVSMPAGFKYNMTDLAASIGIHQLAKLGTWIDRRAELARRYAEQLDGLPLTPLEVLADRRHAWQLFIVALDHDVDRDLFRGSLRDDGIGTGVHFPPLHEQACYAAFARRRLPVASDRGRRVVSLPLFNEMADGDVDRVARAARRACRR